MSERGETSFPTGASSRTIRLNPVLAGGEPARPEEKRPADMKRILLVSGLGVLSWISTYVGMLELIQANLGGLDFIMKIVVGMAVAMLMLMIIWLLDQIFAPINTATKMLFVFGYLFLTTISVGFGFGFYWKYLESRSEASRSAESAVVQVQSSLHGAETRLAQLQTTLDVLTEISKRKADDEVAKGNSCPNSRPGDGPRRRLREADATRFAFASQFIHERIAAVRTEVASLDTDLAKVTMQDKSTIDPATGTRNLFMQDLSRRLDRATTGFNAFRTDPQLRQFRADFAERAEKVNFSDEQGGQFTCPDVQLQTALRGVVRAMDELPQLEKPTIASVEGAEATIEAFRRLMVTITGAIQLKLPPSADEIRAEQQRAVRSAESHTASAFDGVSAGLGKRDWIPLMVAVFVDFCLLLVSISRPVNRFVRLTDKMRAAQEWPVIEILGKFHGIHEDETIRKTFEVLRHVVFDFRGVYYAAIPLNGGDNNDDGAGGESPAAMEAYLLNNLFTSFEKEKIFRRVAVSFFPNSFIRKRLGQQRSKYAEVEAFRVFRFNDGAWPEMILSAIMGAAKRVEAEQRRLKAIRDREEEEAAILRAEELRRQRKASRKLWPFGASGATAAVGTTGAATSAGAAKSAEPTLEGPFTGMAAEDEGDETETMASATATAAASPDMADGPTASAERRTPDGPGYEVTEMLSHFRMMMDQQRAIIEQQNATIEELARTQRATLAAGRGDRLAERLGGLDEITGRAPKGGDGDRGGDRGLDFDGHADGVNGHAVNGHSVRGHAVNGEAHDWLGDRAETRRSAEEDRVGRAGTGAIRRGRSYHDAPSPESFAPDASALAGRGRMGAATEGTASAATTVRPATATPAGDRAAFAARTPETVVAMPPRGTEMRVAANGDGSGEAAAFPFQAGETPSHASLAHSSPAHPSSASDAAALAARATRGLPPEVAVLPRARVNGQQSSGFVPSLDQREPIRPMVAEPTPVTPQFGPAVRLSAERAANDLAAPADVSAVADGAIVSTPAELTSFLDAVTRRTGRPEAGGATAAVFAGEPSLASPAVREPDEIIVLGNRSAESLAREEARAHAEVAAEQSRVLGGFEPGDDVLDRDGGDAADDLMPSESAEIDHQSITEWFSRDRSKGKAGRG
ncbi:MAG: hypothetical protein R3D33_13210 [Hyphomicrobiaceae bacterium]